MDDELRKYLSDMEERIGRRIDERCEKVETSLLTELHKWASPVESGMRTHRAWFNEVEGEIEALKERMRKLEGGERAS